MRHQSTDFFRNANRNNLTVKWPVSIFSFFPFHRKFLFTHPLSIFPSLLAQEMGRFTFFGGEGGLEEEEEGKGSLHCNFIRSAMV